MTSSTAGRATRPASVQALTLKQYVAVYNVLRNGRDIVGKGELTPDDAVEHRHLLNVMEREFGLSCQSNGNATMAVSAPDLAVIREVLGS